MRRIGLIVLLVILAVATLFAASCKGKIGKPNFPEKQSVFFVDLGAGAGWQELNSLPTQRLDLNSYGAFQSEHINNTLSAFYPRSGSGSDRYLPLSATSSLECLRCGSKIRFFRRLAPSEMRQLFFSPPSATDLKLYPISIGDALYDTGDINVSQLHATGSNFDMYETWDPLPSGSFQDKEGSIYRVANSCYLVDENNPVLPVDKSDYEKEGYILFEFKNIPANSSRLYAWGVLSNSRFLLLRAK